MQEEWRDVPGYGGRYQVSSLGRVRKSVTEYLLSQSPNTSGHLQVSLLREGKTKKCLVHRLVAMAFLGRPAAEKPLALHRDDDKTNNAISNLYWGTHKDNRRDAFKNETAAMPNNRGCRNGAAKLTEEDVLDIRKRLATGVSREEIAGSFGVSESTVKSIGNKQRWAWLSEVA